MLVLGSLSQVSRLVIVSMSTSVVGTRSYAMRRLFCDVCSRRHEGGLGGPVVGTPNPGSRAHDRGVKRVSRIRKAVEADLAACGLIGRR